MSSYIKELEQELSRLDKKAETFGAEDVRKKISSALELMTEVGGKDNARLVIQEIRIEFGEIGGRHSEKRIRGNESRVSSPEMEFDDIVA